MRQWVEDRITAAIETVQGERASLLETEIEDLEDQIDNLEAEKIRTSREIEHKLGLHRKQIEAERDNLAKTHEVAVREAKVAAKEEAMKASMDLLGTHVERMERMTEIMVGALPKAEILAQIGGFKNGE